MRVFFTIVLVISGIVLLLVRPYEVSYYLGGELMYTERWWKAVWIERVGLNPLVWRADVNWVLYVNLWAPWIGFAGLWWYSRTLPTASDTRSSSNQTPSGPTSPSPNRPK